MSLFACTPLLFLPYLDDVIFEWPVTIFICNRHDNKLVSYFVKIIENVKPERVLILTSWKKVMWVVFSKVQKQETNLYQKPKIWKPWFEEEFDNVSKKINFLMPKNFEGHKLNAFRCYHQNFLKSTGKIKVSRPSIAWRRVTKNNCKFGGKYFVNTPKSCLYFFVSMVGFQILESRSGFWKPNNLVEVFLKNVN